MPFAAVHESASGHISALDGPHRGKLSFSQPAPARHPWCYGSSDILLKFGLGPSPGGACTHISLRAERSFSISILRINAHFVPPRSSTPLAQN